MNRYQHRKSQGLCPQCGVSVEPGANVLCSKCSEYHRQRRSMERVRQPNKERTPEFRERRNVRNAQIREEAILAYGGRCVCCGEDYLPYLELDHIDGGGKKERQEIGSASTFWRYLKRNNWPNHMQCLCSNCHRAKTSKKPCKPHS